jgi:acetyltransferase-like isoleucine patch superfamily enzyme
MLLIRLIYKVFIKINNYLYKKYSTIICFIILKLNNVDNVTSLTSYGVPIIMISRFGKLILGDNISIHNNAKYAILGRSNKSKFYVYNNANISIGNNVGMSNVVIICYKEISIGNNVLLGGGVTIVDTDFHSLDAKFRGTDQDFSNTNIVSVLIKDNVFIGMNSIILKGVIIGANSIIAAGSVVVKSVPANEVWGGNPAKFIKKNNL